jgi:ribosome-binding protein aMBF1 (putative translation factor)
MPSKTPKRSAVRPLARRAGVGASDGRWSTVYGKPCLVDRGRVTHVLVPRKEYEDLMRSRLATDVAEQFSREGFEGIDLDSAALKLAASRVAQVRQQKGLTQMALSKKLGIPQSQLSRIEKNPERSTVRTLKRIARALGVDVTDLLKDHR